jgi:hypothetical protein
MTKTAMKMIQEMKNVRDERIALELASGRSTNEIAEQFDLTPNSVSRIAKKDRSREIIEQETKKLLGIVPSITDQLQSDIQLSQKLSRFLANPASEPSVATDTPFADTKEILEFQKQVYKKQQDVMKAVGIFPTNSTNIFIQQIYNDNRKQVLSAEVFQALGGIFAGQLGEDDEDVEEAEVKLLTSEDENEDEDND